MDILNMTDEEIDERYLADFIAAWNRNYGGMGGEMTYERIERVAAMYPEPHARMLPCADCGRLIPVADEWDSSHPVWCLECYSAQLGGEEAA